MIRRWRISSICSSGKRARLGPPAPPATPRSSLFAGRRTFVGCPLGPIRSDEALKPYRSRDADRYMERYQQTGGGGDGGGDAVVT